jgi:PAS domain S-box-containing protein
MSLAILKEEIFEALFHFANEAILIVATDGTIVMANPAAEKLFGYDNGELLQKAVEVLIPQRFAANHHSLRNNFNQQPHARSMGVGRDLFGITQSGEEFPVEVSLSPFNSGSQKFIIAFIIDISIRKSNEADIQKKQLELEQLTTELEKRVKERTMILEEALQQLEISREELQESLEKEKELNEMKSRFVSMASHEFRTPLATILSSLSLANKYEELNNKEKRAHHIQRIKTAVVHMTDLLDDVLSISKLEEGKINVVIESFEIVSFANQLVQELQGLSKPGQIIQYKHQGGSLVFQDKKYYA